MKPADPRLLAGFAVALLVTAAPGAAAAVSGEPLFQHCYACHSIEPSETGLPGPNLHGIVGRPIGQEPGFDYSPAFRAFAEKEGNWTEALLDRFLEAPEEVVRGTWMSFPGLSDPSERQALIAWLAVRGGS